MILIKTLLYTLLGEISFFDGVENITHDCSKQATPTSYDQICTNFLNVSDYQFKDHTNAGKKTGRGGVDEVHLIQISTGRLNVDLFLSLMPFHTVCR